MNADQSSKYSELEATCRLWIAVSAAKDERIAELEAECNKLRQRVARLGRQVGRRQLEPGQTQVRFAR